MSYRGARRRVDVLLVADAGGHLAELLALRAAWQPLTRSWAIPTSMGALDLRREGERVHELAGPTRRSFVALVKNIVRGFQILSVERPHVVVAAGAAAAVPVVWVAWLYGIRVIFIENAGRIGTSVSRRLVLPFVDHCYVQWVELADPEARKVVYAGSALFDYR